MSQIITSNKYYGSIGDNSTEGLQIIPTLENYSRLNEIEGVKLIKYPIFPSEGGDFSEYIRINDTNVSIGKGESTVLLENFKIRQISRSYMVPGVVKAWHIHSKQNEVFFPTDGRFLIGLYDNRKDSSTFGMKMRIYGGRDNPIAIYIPSGVAHGLMNIGADQCLLIYMNDQQWDGSDEGRIPWNNKEINFDWAIPNE